MKTSVTSAISILAGIRLAFASPAAEPAVTPPPLVPRQASPEFLGYFIGDVSGGTTSWISDACIDGYTLATASSVYKCCPIDGTCNMYTGCSGSVLVGAATSATCTDSPGAICTFDLLYQSLDALIPQTYPYCASQNVAGTNYYRVTTPATTTSSSESSTTPITTPPSTTTSSSSSSASSSVSSTPVPPQPSSKTPIGAIIGGAVGGFAVLALFALGIFFLLKKSRGKSNAGIPYGEVSTTPMPPPVTQQAYVKPGLETSVSPVQSPYGSPVPPYQQYNPSAVPGVYSPSSVPPNVAELAEPPRNSQGR